MTARKRWERVLTDSLVHHVALGARDVARLSDFYERALGLRRVKEHVDEGGQLRSIWLSLHGSEATKSVLMIERTGAGAAAPTVSMQPSPGWFLLAFAVPRAEREQQEARLIAAGASLEGRTGNTTYARDPEGNRFAISCYPLAEVCDRTSET